MSLIQRNTESGLRAPRLNSRADFYTPLFTLPLDSNITQSGASESAATTTKCVRRARLARASQMSATLALPNTWSVRRQETCLKNGLMYELVAHGRGMTVGCL